jgi:hypothetical protein
MFLAVVKRNATLARRIVRVKDSRNSYRDSSLFQLRKVGVNDRARSSTVGDWRHYEQSLKKLKEYFLRGFWSKKDPSLHPNLGKI